MTPREWLFGPGLLVFGLLTVASQFRYAEGASIWMKARYLFSAVRDGGNAGEGRIAAVGFAAIFGGAMCMLGIAYNFWSGT